MIGNLGLKNAIVSFILEMLRFSSLNASQQNLASLCVSFLNDFVSELYWGMNLEK